MFGPYNQLKTYTATCGGTISAGASKIVGQCNDTSGHRGLASVMTRRGKPAKTCKVPKLHGATLKAAKRALTRANCSVGKVTNQRSKKVRKRRVISSSPKAGTRHPAGKRVNLIVSRG